MQSTPVYSASRSPSTRSSRRMVPSMQAASTQLVSRLTARGEEGLSNSVVQVDSSLTSYGKHMQPARSWLSWLTAPKGQRRGVGRCSAGVGEEICKCRLKCHTTSLQRSPRAPQYLPTTQLSTFDTGDRVVQLVRKQPAHAHVKATDCAVHAASQDLGTAKPRAGQPAGELFLCCRQDSHVCETVAVSCC